MTFAKQFKTHCSALLLSKAKTQNFNFLPKTIFAFLMLNTMSLAYNKIFGAKFLNFEHLETICLYTACYKVFYRKRYEIRLAIEPLFSAIEPLLHSHTATVVIQQSFFYSLIVALSDRKRGFIVMRECCLYGILK